MNTITFSSYEASTTGTSTLCSGVGYNVEIKKEDTPWCIWAVAQKEGNSRSMWKLTHIRVVGNEKDYPCLVDTASFILDLDAYIDTLMNKLIPSHQNA